MDGYHFDNNIFYDEVHVEAELTKMATTCSKPEST